MDYGHWDFLEIVCYDIISQSNVIILPVTPLDELGNLIFYAEH